MNDTKEKTCAERIADQLASEERNLSDIYAVLDGEIKPTEDESETHYRFSDWFDTATEEITDKDSSLYRYAQEMINIQEGAI